MKENRKNTLNVPNLRFPEFSGEWIEKRFDEIASDFSYGMNSAAIEFDGNNKYIRITDIDENTREFVPNPLTSPDGTIEDKYKLSKGDIVFARTGASVGKSYLYNENDGNLYYAGFLIKANVDRANESFVFFNTLRSNYNKWVKIMSMRSGQPGINAEEYRSLKLKIPSFSEQNKIAKLLTVIDGRISTQNKIIEDYKLLKKGMMQRIFNQEMRFKDANDCNFSEWENIRLGDIYSFKSTNSLSRDNLNLNYGLVKNIHYGDIHTKYHSHFDVEKEIVPFINANTDIKRFSDDCYIQEGDLVIADASEDYADIGKAVEVVNINKGKILAGLHTLLARRKDKRLTVGFAGHLMKTQYVRLAIMRISQGTKVLGISTKRLAEINLSIPPIPEQIKIVSTLSALDKKIGLETEHLDKLKSQKQYFLQNLFI
nr:restriction endonuclease subunit S [uncultured Carboxylicivirga sp.]